MTRTKIICTMGPAVNTLEQIKALIEAGMNVARLNFSHGSHEQHKATIALLKQARQELDAPLAIMLDTKGPEIRLGVIGGGSLILEPKQRIRLVQEEVQGSAEQISIKPANIVANLTKGMKVLFDDGLIASHVVETGNGYVVVELVNGGPISSGKGVNVPNAQLDLPAMTDRDIEDIRFGCEEDIDVIAASFIRSADQIMAIKGLLNECGAPTLPVIAKIENGEGIQNFDTILQVADGIMIARGDLGVEVPLAQVPRLQKMMIRKSFLAGKPSVTATQMLESMIYHPRPTRAEASDVANAIYDSTSAVMLSGETAVGKYPVETVRLMKSIIQEAERDFQYRSFFDYHSQLVYNDVPSAVTLASVKTAYSSGAKAIFAFTNSGNTARMISRLRPEMPIIALTPVVKSYHRLAMHWGITPYLCPARYSFEEAFADASRIALDNHQVQYGDLVIVTAGTPFGISGTTNMMIVESIGDVLVRGHSGIGSRVYGKVAVLFSPDKEKQYEVKDHILVITKCDDSYLPLLKHAKGVILQNHIDDVDSEKYVLLISKTLNKPALVRADGACTVLNTGTLVTIDPAKGLVYKGAVLEKASANGKV